jgi:hypothetical protein
MAWMTMWPYVAGVVQPGRSTRISVRGRTSSASPAGCTELWLLSTALRSAYLGKASLTKKPSQYQFLITSQSYLALGLVDTVTAPTPTMS